MRWVEVWAPKKQKKGSTTGYIRKGLLIRAPKPQAAINWRVLNFYVSASGVISGSEDHSFRTFGLSFPLLLTFVLSSVLVLSSLNSPLYPLKLPFYGTFTFNIYYPFFYLHYLSFHAVIAVWQRGKTPMPVSPGITRISFQWEVFSWYCLDGLSSATDEMLTERHQLTYYTLTTHTSNWRRPLKQLSQGPYDL